MREKLNNNPLAQVILLGVLLVAAGFLVLSSMSGGESGEGASNETAASPTTEATEAAQATLTVTGAPEAATQVAAPPPGSLAKAAPPPPRAVTAAFESDKTVVLLFVRNGGIDDRIVARSVERLGSLSGVTTFVVPARRIARYAAITQGVSVSRVPALVVLRPKRLGHGIPTASVRYGFQGPQSIVQAVVDAGYKGPTVDYHP